MSWILKSFSNFMSPSYTFKNVRNDSQQLFLVYLIKSLLFSSSCLLQKSRLRFVHFLTLKRYLLFKDILEFFILFPKNLSPPHSLFSSVQLWENFFKKSGDITDCPSIIDSIHLKCLFFREKLLRSHKRPKQPGKSPR